ncbi:MAG: gliding motility-associated C-terminal domain-containing protein [Bacteroidetes bacterium]|nr:gliding motility-associated C-terminal domain-containing protein [Bacteroidota bacterium]
MKALKISLIFIISLLFTKSFAQIVNWNAYPSNAVSWSPSSVFNVSKSTAGGGAFDVRSSASSGTSPISGSQGAVAQNCSNYTGLRLEMQGAGNSAGNAVWDNSVTVTVNFPTYLCAPVTFTIFDVTETFYFDGTNNFVNYQDKVIINALDNFNAPVAPTAVSTGGIDNVLSGTSRMLIANGTGGQCLNQAVTVGSPGQMIKQITITYCNQDLPTHCPAPVGSPPRYGISQYEYVFISPIFGTSSPTASISSPTVACGVTSTTLTASTSASSPTYSWTGPVSSTVTSPSSSSTGVSGAGVYSVIINPGGCSSTATFNLASGSPPSATASNSSTLTCNTPTAQLTGGGGGTYSWAGSSFVSGQTSANPIVNAPGIYTVTVTGSNGCTATATTALTQNTIAAPVQPSTNTITCSNPTVSISANTTLTPVSYSWSGTGIIPPSNTSTINVNQAGTFNYTVTNTNNGCSTTGSISVSQNSVLPVVTAGNTGSLNCTNTTANAYATTASSPVSYNWSGTGITSGSGTGTITVNQGGVFGYTVVNTSNNCKTSGTISVTQNTVAPTPTASASNSITCMSNTVALNGGPSALSYTWSGPSIVSGVNSQNAVANAPGNYTLLVKGSNGCTNTAVAIVGNNLTTPTVSAGSNQTITCAAPTVTLNGNASIGSNYNWSNGATTASNSVGGAAVYTLTATNPISGCSATSTVQVFPSAGSPTGTLGAVSNSITCTNTNVAVSISSTTTPLSITWSGSGISGPSNASLTTVSQGGTYTVTIVNTSNSCSQSYQVVVPSNTSAVIANASSTSTITCNTASVNITSTPTGTNYNYSWSGPGTIVNGNTSNPTVNSGGSYVVTITNTVNGCVGTATTNVSTNTISPTLTLSPTSLTTTCANPSATLSASSNAGPSASYTWTAPGSGSLNNPNASNPIANGSGVFTVQVGNTTSGCVSALQTLTITASNNTPTLIATASSATICSGQTATLTVSGADTYTWSNMQSTSSITVNPTSSTTYSVAGTNTLSGCYGITNINVNVAPTSSIAIAATSTAICNGSSVTLTLSGGTTYTVTNPSQTTTNTITLNPSTQTTYTVTGELSGCATNTETITINVNALPNISVSNATTCAGVLVIISASGADTYSWNTGATTSTISVSPNNNTTYTVVGTSTLTGCTSTVSSLNVSVNQLPSIAASAASNVVCTTGTVSLNVTSSGTAAVSNYTWALGNGINTSNQNQSNPAFSASTITPGTYTYMVTASDANGCISPQATTTLNVINLQNVAMNLSDLNICQNQSGIINVSNPQLGATYNWTINGQPVANVSPLVIPSSVSNASGTYTVNVEVSVGSCTNSANNTLTVNALPSVSLTSYSVSVCQNSPAGLVVANPIAGNVYSWSYNNQSVGSGTSYSVNSVSPSNAGTYTVTVTDRNGCANRTIGIIDAQACQTYVPQIFTPNGDGKNDVFLITNIEYFPNNKLNIFNRWGNLVYTKEGYLNEFAGYANTGTQIGNDKLPAGTYYVILEYGDGKTQTYTGFLVLQY